MMQELIPLDPDYKKLILQLKEKVLSARMRAMLEVSAEQIQLYWEIGKAILERQQQSKWGSKLLAQVSFDLRKNFPEMKGFSRRNLFLMRQFAHLYPGKAIVQQSVAQLPWGHIIILIQKVKNAAARTWYAEQTIREGWSRDSLQQFIRSDLYSRQGIKTQFLFIHYG